MSVSEIKDTAFFKHLRKKCYLHVIKNTNLKKYGVCNLRSNSIPLIIHALFVFTLNGS